MCRLSLRSSGSWVKEMLHTRTRSEEHDKPDLDDQAGLGTIRGGGGILEVEGTESGNSGGWGSIGRRGQDVAAKVTTKEIQHPPQEVSIALSPHNSCR